jgi:hypothetical protein
LFWIPERQDLRETRLAWPMHVVSWQLLMIQCAIAKGIGHESSFCVLLLHECQMFLGTNTHTHTHTYTHIHSECWLLNKSYFSLVIDIHALTNSLQTTKIIKVSFLGAHAYIHACINAYHTYIQTYAAEYCKNHRSFFSWFRYGIWARLIGHGNVSFVCMYICMHVCVYVCMYVRIYVNYIWARRMGHGNVSYVCMFVCLYVCTYVRMYVHVCMHNSIKS